MLGPPIVEAPVVSWCVKNSAVLINISARAVVTFLIYCTCIRRMMQRGIPTLVYGSTVGKSLICRNNFLENISALSEQGTTCRDSLFIPLG